IPFSSGRRRLPEKLRASFGLLCQQVSIPFSSGRRRLHRPSFRESMGSYLVSIPFSSGRRRLLLFTTALTASLLFVSIPFSSGRRRLLLSSVVNRWVGTRFQSPSHRGGGASRRDHCHRVR